MYVLFRVLFTNFFLSSHCIKIYKFKKTKNLAELDLAHKDPPLQKVQSNLATQRCANWHTYRGGISL